MPITLTPELALFEGHCAIEEAETLQEWLHRTEQPSVDLSRCEHIHTAILQILLASRPSIAQAPADAFVARLVGTLPISIDYSPEKSTS